MFNYTEEELKKYLVANGTERSCYYFPQEPNAIYKLSLHSKAKQTKREIKYFQYLQKKNIPFTHLPRLLEVIETKKYTGFKQEIILGENGLPARHLWQLLSDEKSDKEKLRLYLYDLFKYLYKYNIQFCDLNPDNMVLDEKAGKIFLIDGLGCTDFFPYSVYFKSLGRKKIIRKCAYFMHFHPLLANLFNNNKNPLP